MSAVAAAEAKWGIAANALSRKNALRPDAIKERLLFVLSVRSLDGFGTGPFYRRRPTPLAPAPPPGR
jgi:hypothetical protein